MPAFLKTSEDEARWERAKQRAAEEGHAEDWAYVTGIYKRMNGGDVVSKRAAYFNPAQVKHLSRPAFAQLLGENARYPLKSTSEIYKQMTLRPDLRHLDGAEVSAYAASHPHREAVYKNLLDHQQQVLNPFWQSFHTGKQPAVMPHVSEGWTHFLVNNHVPAAPAPHTEKLYATVPEVHKWTADRTRNILNDLVAEGYKGQLKYPHATEHLLTRFDGLVLHPNAPKDVEIAHKVLHKHLGSLDVQVERGLDRPSTHPHGSASYNELLAEHARNVRVNAPVGHNNHEPLPDEFYRYTGLQAPKGEATMSKSASAYALYMALQRG